MAPLNTTDLLVGVAALSVASVAIYLFVRATGGGSKAERTEPTAEPVEEEVTAPQLLRPGATGGRFEIPQLERRLSQSDVERARSNLRTLTLQRELLTMVLKRLFEAEDEGEITREERIRLSRGYEAELKKIGEELKQAELVATLHELESIRDDIMKKFEAILSDTQAKIDAVVKELKLEKPAKPPAKAPRRRRPKKKEEAEGEEPEEEKPRARRRGSEVEEKLEQLRREVLKELEELEKLEIEV
ncbi:MAG: hypothetical protein ACE5OO_08320 [Candidatus Bathyarchaeia archaeon]